MKKLLITLGFKMINTELVIWSLEKYVFPLMEKYAKKTDNLYDDKAVKYISGFLREIAGEVDEAKKEMKRLSCGCIEGDYICSFCILYTRKIKK